MEPPIKIHPEICGGTPCFNGTRVFVSTLFDHLARGYTLDEILADFPTLKREQLVETLRLAHQSVLQHALVVAPDEVAA